jgi:hypothetical protein
VEFSSVTSGEGYSGINTCEAGQAGHLQGDTQSFFEGVEEGGLHSLDQQHLQRCNVKFDAEAASLALEELAFCRGSISIACTEQWTSKT